MTRNRIQVYWPHESNAIQKSISKHHSFIPPLQNFLNQSWGHSESPSRICNRVETTSFLWKMKLQIYRNVISGHSISTVSTICYIEASCQGSWLESMLHHVDLHWIRELCNTQVPGWCLWQTQATKDTHRIPSHHIFKWMCLKKCITKSQHTPVKSLHLG